MDVHRKTVRRGHEPGDCHALTFSCHRRLPLLANGAWCRLLAESIDRAMQSQGFALVAFVFMPEHVHLLVYPTTCEPRMDLLLRAIKRPFSWRIKRELLATGSPFSDDLAVRERPGVDRFRFWLEGGGYDRNVRSESAVLAAIDYIHLNPMRRGLCDRAEDWAWSSARQYHCPVDEIPVGTIPRVVGLPPEFWSTRT